MVLILKNAHVVDPAAGIDAVIDVKVEDDRIAEVGHGLAHEGAEVRELIDEGHDEAGGDVEPRCDVALG